MAKSLRFHGSMAGGQTWPPPRRGQVATISARNPLREKDLRQTGLLATAFRLARKASKWRERFIHEHAARASANASVRFCPGASRHAVAAVSLPTRFDLLLIIGGRVLKQPQIGSPEAGLSLPFILSSPSLHLYFSIPQHFAHGLSLS